MTTPLTVSCPTCNKPVVWNEHSLFRPFCSKRCQLIDLGEWVDEEKRIPGEPAWLPDQDGENEY